MEVKKENPELKPYIENFVIEMLEGCELFVNTYGKGFAKERLGVNFKKLYTEKLNDRIAGQYVLGTSGEITLFAKGSNGNMLTFEDVENNHSLKTTALHESIHAIFNKTPDECKALGIQTGTGIMSTYQNPDRELGRGLNEGYTNWVCEKAGLKTTSYAKFTNTIKLFEIAIGPEKVMQFGKGDIERNITSLLNMDSIDCTVLFSKADSIYDFDELSQEYYDIYVALIDKLKFEKEREKNPEAKMPDYAYKAFEKLNHSSFYVKILKDQDYIKYAKDNGLDFESEENQKEYFFHMNEVYHKKGNVLLQDIQSEILSKYFMKELEEITSMNTSSAEQYQKFSTLAKLLLTYDEHTNDILKSFDEQYNNLRNNFFNTASNDIKKYIEEGTLSAEQLALYNSIFSNGDYGDSRKFSNIISKLMLPEKPQIYEIFFERLSRQDMVADVFNYQILELETPNGTKANLFFDTQKNNHFSRYIQTPKILGVSDKIENPNTIIDITLSSLQSTQKIVKSFLTLKEELRQKDPNTKMQIVDNIIVTSGDGKEPTYYMIEGNNIVLAKSRELLPQNRKTEEKKLAEDNNKDNSNLNLKKINAEKQLENPLSTQEDNNTSNKLNMISKNPFKRFLLEIRKRVFKREEVAISIANKHQSEATKIADESKAFNDRIHIDIDNSNISIQPTQNNTKTKDKDDDFSK